MKTERKRTELGAATFVFIFFCRSGNEYRNPENEYGNRYYRKRIWSEYEADTKPEVRVTGTQKHLIHRETKNLILVYMATR